MYEDIALEVARVITEAQRRVARPQTVEDVLRLQAVGRAHLARLGKPVH